MTGDNSDEGYEAARDEPDPAPSQSGDMPFLVTAEELRARRTKRRRERTSAALSRLLMTNRAQAKTPSV